MATEKRLIDANALGSWLCELACEPDYQHPGEDWRVGVYMADSLLQEMPTVDAVEVVHGRWRWKDGCFHCSNCKTSNDHTPKYCEGCGAKMDGDGNG